MLLVQIHDSGTDDMQVRIVNIVRETSPVGARKRRATSYVYFFVEVGNSATDGSTPVDLGETILIIIIIIMSAQVSTSVCLSLSLYVCLSPEGRPGDF